ncbi:MAG: ABC-F family ATP-binding cassette domain-containing protein [Desulfonatronovibrio sp.]
MTPSELLVSCSDISKSYAEKPLFSDLNLGFHAQERTGLIGPNGSGKSTLLKIMAGIVVPDTGQVIPKGDVRLVYLSQSEDFSFNQSVEQALWEVLPDKHPDPDMFAKISKIADQAGFRSLDTQVSTLSGGWIKRLSIVRALIQEPDLLLLDEPTNHLDIEGIVWLEKTLVRPDFTFVLVSHDRAFLENVTNKIVELNKLYPDGFLEVKGNYSLFLEKREEFAASQGKLEQALANKTRREIEWLRRGPKARTTKARYRINAAHALQDELGEVRSRNQNNKAAGIEFSATGRKTKKLLQAQGVTLERENRTLFGNLDIVLSPGSCLGIMGSNGAGKSSLLQILSGDILPDDGKVLRADGLKIVYFDQGREQLDQDKSLKDALCPSGDQVVFQGRPLHVVSWAKRMRFTPEQLPLPVSRLSGGEQSRLLIARLMLETADVLLLDEPTNDIDIPTLEILEQSLSEFPGAIVLISHDRMFLNNLCDKLLFLDGQGESTYFADISQCLDALVRQKKAQQSSSESGEVKKSRSKPARPGKMSYKDQLELESIEKDIEKAEQTVAGLKQEMNLPQVMIDAEKLEGLCARLSLAEEHVQKLYERWDELEKLAEQLRM